MVSLITDALLTPSHSLTNYFIYLLILILFKSVDFKFSQGQSFAASRTGAGTGWGQGGGVCQGRWGLGRGNLTDVEQGWGRPGGHTHTVHI